jgi:hypothetical protein
MAVGQVNGQQEELNLLQVEAMGLRWLVIYRATESASGVYVEVVLGNHPDQRNRCQN